MSRQMEIASEDVLVSRSARGDEQAFGVLVERYKGMLYSMSRRLMKDPGRAEDAAQESFIKAWAALPGFKGESKFSSWLYRICYNTCISELRKRKPEVELDEATGVPVEGPAQDFLNRNIQATIQEEVSRLPDDYRAAVTLYHFSGLSYEEIAKLTHKPMGTVKAHIHRARAVLRTRLVERIGWDNLKEVMWQ
ncbi:sigma-70 family RNA polymerase sigma factor [candidate division WOR-3 bacterium]|uniref:Sigma-70 family RNA polymerase sigma factor n=1 Tax=candidate division WOR-3 bacterium TaxID=2052148 RepID=A0A937XDT1_UNCW3|nr:sigma-70 family RNA polymerase sigma factor [candidate division WOR-3 bacterium]